MNQEDIALIDRFLMGELEGEELAAFNRRVAEDEQFREDLELLRSIGKVSKRMEMRSHLKGVEEQIRFEETSKKTGITGERDGTHLGNNILFKRIVKPEQSKRSYKPLFTLLAAACVVGIVGMVFLINKDDEPIRYGDPHSFSNDSDSIPSVDSSSQDTSQLGKFKQLIEGLDMGGGDE